MPIRPAMLRHAILRMSFPLHVHVHVHAHVHVVTDVVLQMWLQMWFLPTKELAHAAEASVLGAQRGGDARLHKKRARRRK